MLGNRGKADNGMEVVAWLGGGLISVGIGKKAMTAEGSGMNGEHWLRGSLFPPSFWIVLLCYSPLCHQWW